MKKIFVDIDETICYYKGNRDYNLALPILKRIEKINKLFDEGNEITYWTARGSVTGLDWYEVTKNQLKKWGCKYNNLSVGEKPHFDLYICDKSINSEAFFNDKKEKKL
jgi:CMP-N,N'-diacetyllegionaminic acid synthase